MNEFEACASIEKKTLFILGFARSSTTILAQIINTSKNSFILGEANFYLGRMNENFCKTYNEMHQIEFNNQVSKSSYAPHLLGEDSHTWWEWMVKAANYYEIIGDKVAFSSHHFSQTPREEIISFYEQRFFGSKYIFPIRDPFQTLNSLQRLSKQSGSKFILENLAAWLDYIQLWSDCIRIFPNTLTILSEDIDASIVGKLEKFTGQNLKDAELLLNDEEKGNHQKSIKKLPFMGGISEELDAIYSAAKRASLENSVFLQADQKRTEDELDTRSSESASMAIAPYPIGELWVRAETLKNKIKMIIPEQL